MAEGHLDARVPSLKDPDLAELSGAFNRMAEALERQRAKLEQMALTDGLTGVFNHRRFQEALGQEVIRSARTGRPISVLMIDVDHFKRINDTHGHPAGDVLL